MPDRVRILLLDDHVLIREALGRLLESQSDFEVVGQAATVEEAIENVRTRPIDLVLLDINLGSQQGTAFLPAAQAEGFRGRVLVVTAGVSRVEAARLRQRGCAGIFLKNEKPSRLIEKIRSVMADGEGSEPAGPAPPPDLSVVTPRSFTPREREVLQHVCQGQTNKEIAFELGISEPLVKAFVQQLFAKTGVRNRAQLVRIAVEQFWEELGDGAQPT